MRRIIHLYSWPVVWSLLQPSLQLAAEKKSNVCWDSQKLEKRVKSCSLDSISCKNKRITHILIDHFKKENWKRCVVETIHVCLWRCVPVPVLELETQQIFKPSSQQLPWKKKQQKVTASYCPHNPQDLISYSPFLTPHISLQISWESLQLHQNNTLQLITLSNLVACLLHNVLEWRGEFAE